MCVRPSTAIGGEELWVARLAMANVGSNVNHKIAAKLTNELYYLCATQETLQLDYRCEQHKLQTIGWRFVCVRMLQQRRLRSKWLITGVARLVELLKNTDSIFRPVLCFSLYLHNRVKYINNAYNHKLLAEGVRRERKV